MNSHSLRWLPFLAGTLFTVALAGWLILVSDLLSFSQFAIIGPLALIGLGLVGVAATFRKEK